METCPKCRSEWKYVFIGSRGEFECGSKIEPGKLTRSKECIETETIKNCAAGPWQEGEPPKDGERYIGWWPERPLGWQVIKWEDWLGKWVLTSGVSIAAPIKHMKINLPDGQ